MDPLFSSLSLLPVLVLLVMSLWRGVRVGIYAGLAVTTLLFFVWDSQLIAFPAALVAALIDTITILMIVFGALLLHQSMEQAGFIERIKHSLKGAHSDVGFQFYFLAFFLTAFFESVAGFGTPGAIVPLLLISLGYSAVLSIVVVLLIDGLMAITGAIGTPVIAGLEGPLNLPASQVTDIYLYAAGFMVISGVVVLLFIQRFVQQERPGARADSWKLFLSLALPFVALAYFLQELTGVVASALMGGIAYFFLFTNRSLAWRPWLPYGVLVIVLLLPKLIAPLGELLGFPIEFEGMFGSEVDASMQPLRSPLFPFIIAALVAVLLGQNRQVNLRPVLNKTFGVFLILLPSLAITRLMLASGGETPSMVAAMSELFAKTGAAYPVLSPFIGVMGTFITGSTTVSNIIFGPVQFSAAGNLGLPQELILAMQLNGASLGNAVCLFNIIAAAAVAGVDKYAAILNKNLLPVAAAALLTGLGGWLLLLMG